MKTIVLFDPSIATMNHGDDIIYRSFLQNGADLLSDCFVMRFPTHTPCFLPWQQWNRNRRFRTVRQATYKLIIGSSILCNRMLSPWPSWNIHPFNVGCYKDAVLVGVGVTGYRDTDATRPYSRHLYRSFLSKTHVHSVRDERTRRILEKMGLKAIDTGCPTLWGLNEAHCARIPKAKGRICVMTLTDYCQNPVLDTKLIALLLEHYEQVAFWPQGSGDFEYLKTLPRSRELLCLPAQLDAFDRYLSQKDVDYVGTRLHAGIFALQHARRSVILKVDNRSEDMAQAHALPVVARDALDDIEAHVASSFETRIRLQQANIRAWKRQFT